ncbi:unnamed protein product, partial [Mesorhabditis belari]|uniref:Uncharacterized protein n=1 Tax=Mesorhabditis belari TaxID=2138241 RepID=A0AAF3EII6_9BILA
MSKNTSKYKFKITSSSIDNFLFNLRVIRLLKKRRKNMGNQDFQLDLSQLDDEEEFLKNLDSLEETKADSCTQPAVFPDTKPPSPRIPLGIIQSPRTPRSGRKTPRDLDGNAENASLRSPRPTRFPSPPPEAEEIHRNTPIEQYDNISPVEIISRQKDGSNRKEKRENRPDWGGSDRERQGDQLAPSTFEPIGP